MLVLDIPAGRSFTIGSNIVVKVLKNKRGRMKVGITAPREVSVVRGELREKPKGDAA